MTLNKVQWIGLPDSKEEATPKDRQIGVNTRKFGRTTPRLENNCNGDTRDC